MGALVCKKKRKEKKGTSLSARPPDDVSTELFVVGSNGTTRIYIVLKRFCFEKYEAKITRCPAAASM